MSKQVVVTLPVRNPKKHSIRFDTDKAESPISSLYLSNGADAELGHPKGIKVVISSAEMIKESTKGGK